MTAIGVAGLTPATDPVDDVDDAQPTSSSSVGRFVLLLPVVLAAVTIRMLLFSIEVPLCAYGAHDPCLGTNVDGSAVLAQAHSLVDGDGLVSTVVPGTPGASIGPLGPVVYGVASGGGFTTDDRLRLLAAFVGGLGVLAIGIAAWRAVTDRRGPPTGLVAAGLAAVAPMLWINDVLVVPENVAVPLVAVAVAVACWWWGHRGWRGSVALGGVLGLVALARPDLLLFGLVLLGWAILAAAGPQREVWRDVGIAAGVAVLVVSPWVLRNLTTLQDSAPLTTATGAELLEANCDQTLTSRGMGGRDPACIVIPGPADDESTVAMAARSRAFDAWSADPARAALAVPVRAARLWGLVGSADSLDYDHEVEGMGPRVPLAATVAFWAMVPFAVGGIVDLRRRRVPLGPLLAAPVAVTLSAALLGATSRWRSPADVSLVILAAVGLVAGAGWLGERWPAALVAARRWSPTRRLGSALGIVGLVGLTLRLAVVYVVRPLCPFGEGATGALSDACFEFYGDPVYYRAQASALASGRGFTLFPGVQGGQHPPGYSSVLALANRLGLESVQDHRAVGAVLGAAGVVLLALLAAQLVRHDRARVALLTGLIAALYPHLWLNDVAYLSEALLVPAIALAGLATVWCWRRPGLGRASLLGLALGAVVLVRSECVIVVPLVAFAFLVQARRRERSARGRTWVVAGAITVAAVVVVLPWVVYNLSRFQQQVLLTSTPWLTLRYTACDSAFEGELLGYYDFRCWPEAPTLGGGPLRSGGRGMEEDAMDALARDEALTYYGAHPGGAVVRVIASAARMAEVWRPLDNLDLATVYEGRGFGASAAGLVWYLALVPLAAVGGWAAWRRGPVPVLLVWIVPAVAAAAIGGAIIRYRAPAEVPLVVLAGIGLWWLAYRPATVVDEAQPDPPPGGGTVAPPAAEAGTSAGSHEN